MRFPGNVVTEDDTRSKGAGRPDKCFYCSGIPGGPHDEECVCIDRPVKLKLTIDLVVTVPRHWSVDQIHFHRNESSWCSDNVMAEIGHHVAARGCICRISEFEYVGEATLEEAVAAGLIPDSEGDMVSKDEKPELAGPEGGIPLSFVRGYDPGTPSKPN